MRILLTGATGFIGSHVARLALARGHGVVALSSKRANRRRLADVREHIEWVDGEIDDADTLARSLRPGMPDACLHLAWHAEPGVYLASYENVGCLTRSLTFAKNLLDAGCPRLVVAGTSLEYAPSSAPVSESSPIEPGSLYAATKHALFATARHLDPRGEWPVAHARVFHLYGPWEDPRRLVPLLVTKLLAGERCELGAGDQTRDYSHVEDVASALLAIAQSTTVGAINVGSSKPVTVATIARRIGEILERPDLVALGARSTSGVETPFLVANTDRLRGELGWTPRFDLESGLAETVRWWRAHGENETVVPRS